MKLPAKAIVSTPMIAALTLLCLSWLATVVFAQTNGAPGSEDFTYQVGRIVLIVASTVALLGIAVAAIYNTFRKAAITEAKDLAEIRKGKLVEKELKIVELEARVRQLERENEDLEKKNFRLQEREH